MASKLQNTLPFRYRFQIFMEAAQNLGPTGKSNLPKEDAPYLAVSIAFVRGFLPLDDAQELSDLICTEKFT